MTSTGRLVAEDVIFRHTTLKKFFTEILTIDDETAEDGACKIEHAAPPQVINRMIDFMKFVKTSPELEKSLISNFKEFIKNREAEKKKNA